MLRVLCVDDVEFVHRDLANLIKLAGREVSFESSTTYHEALRKVTSKQYDIIFVDLCMDGEGNFPRQGYFPGGLKFAEHIRPLTSAKIIAITGYGLSAIDGRDSFDGILLKPLSDSVKGLLKILEDV